MSEERVERLAGEIRALSQDIEDAEKWRVLLPVDVFDDVTDRLETEYDVGTYYNGIRLCWTDTHDEARAEYKSSLHDLVGRTPDTDDELVYGGVCPVCNEEFTDGFEQLQDLTDVSIENVRLCVIDPPDEVLIHLPEDQKTDGGRDE